MAVFNPQIAKDYEVPEAPRQPVIPQFPRLKACFDPKRPWIELDRKLVNSVDEEQACFRSNTAGIWATIPLDTPPAEGTNAES